jgi:hypothetical protein
MRMLAISSSPLVAILMQARRRFAILAAARYAFFHL